MTAARIQTIEDLREAVGTTLGPSSWITVAQDRVDAFARATGDQQWIHVDPERARQSDFGGTIAHGYLTLALAPMLIDQLLDLRQHCTSINYGLNRVRFISPVRVGSRVRLLLQIRHLEDRPDGGSLVTYQLTFEIDGESKPALVAETLSLYLASAAKSGRG